MSNKRVYEVVKFMFVEYREKHGLVRSKRWLSWWLFGALKEFLLALYLRSIFFVLVTMEVHEV